MLVNREQLTQFIPQRPPIVMVDGLKAHVAETSESTLEIRSDNIFVADGRFQVAGLIENIAQTVALRSGYEYSLKIQNGEAVAGKPPVGFIGEVKNLSIHFLPSAGDTIDTKVVLLHNIFTASVVKGQVYCQGQLAAECDMKVFVQA